MILHHLKYMKRLKLFMKSKSILKKMNDTTSLIRYKHLTGGECYPTKVDEVCSFNMLL